MTERNGSPSLIEYETKSGIVCHIDMINIATLRAIKLRAETLYPYPDKTAYKVDLSGGSFADDAIRIAAEIEGAETNPDYIRAKMLVNIERDNYENSAILDIAVKFVSQQYEDGTFQYYTSETLVNRFASQLLKLRRYAELPDDDYEAAVWYCVFNGNMLRPHKDSGALEAVNWDFTYVKQLAIQQIPLSHSEVVAGIRYFRYPVQKQTT